MKTLFKSVIISTLVFSTSVFAQSGLVVIIDRGGDKQTVFIPKQTQQTQQIDIVYENKTY